MKTPALLFLLATVAVTQATTPNVTPRHVLTVSQLATTTPTNQGEIIAVWNDHKLYIATGSTAGQWAAVTGSTGAIGPAGPTGPQGPPGPVARYFTTIGALNAATPRFIGELCTLDTGPSSPTAYVATGTTPGAWTKTAGEPGPTGSPGVNAATWRTGSGVPSASLGADNDLYFRSDAGTVYKKTSGSYSQIANLTGPDGPPGSIEDGQIIYGDGHVPFIDPTTRVIYDQDGTTSAINCGVANQIVFAGFTAWIHDGRFQADTIAVSHLKPEDASREAITLDPAFTLLTFNNGTSAISLEDEGQIVLATLPASPPATRHTVYRTDGVDLNITE